MSTVIQKLTAEGTGESAGFLNDTIKELWPNINVALGKIIKDAVEPMLKSSLPSPLSNLKFTKIDLGEVPLRLSNVKSTKTETGGIEIDMNVDWDGKCDIELDGNMVPEVGVESVELYGRLNIFLCPLTNVIPLIGAAQISFVNPPYLKLDFTGAANIADFSLVDDTIRETILGIINSMFTLPNRYLVKLDASTDYFKTHFYPIGLARITVEQAWGFAEEAKSATKKLFHKITQAHPDCFAQVDVGGEESWKTSTKSNSVKPVWNETKDFVVSDFDQCIKVDVEDHDVNANDQVGLAVTTVREILLAGKKQELDLVRDGEQTGGKVSISCEFFTFAADGSSFSDSKHKGDGKLCGLATVLVASASGIKGKREELNPSVVITWGEKNRYQTAAKTDAPGTDINNPPFDEGFRIPVTPDLVGSKPENFRIALLNGEKEMGGADVPYTDVLNAPDMTLENKFDVGGGTTVRASICLRGVVVGNLPNETLPDRSK